MKASSPKETSSREGLGICSVAKFSFILSNSADSVQAMGLSMLMVSCGKCNERLGYTSSAMPT
jgi:hypothetical protein